MLFTDSQTRRGGGWSFYSVTIPFSLIMIVLVLVVLFWYFVSWRLVAVARLRDNPTLHWTGATTVLVIRTLVVGPGQ